MHLSTPDEQFQSETPSSQDDCPKAEPHGGWGGFLLQAVLWAIAGWATTTCLNFACAPRQHGAPHEERQAPSKR
jgi:hypothetical protein